MTRRDDRFVRLLRWYPRPWRDAHGAVFLDTLRDQADHDGRTSPASGEALAAAVNGLSERLDARLAVAMSMCGIAVAAAVQYVFLVRWAAADLAYLASGGPREPVVQGAWDSALYCASLGLTAMFIMVGVVSLLRTRRLVTAGPAWVVLLTTVPAVALGATAQYAFSLGFDLSDEDLPMVGLAAAWRPLSLAAIGLGVVGLGVCLECLLRRTRLRPVVRVGISLLAAAAITPIIGVFMMPLGWVSVALAVVVLSVRSLSAAAVLNDGGVTHSPVDGRRAVRLLAAISTAVGAFGIVYALTGSLWSPAATDGTVAMGQGITILLAASLPLVVAMGLLARGTADRPLHVWGPLAVLALVIGAVIYGYGDGSDGDRMSLAMPVGSVLLGAGLAWWVTARLRFAGSARVLVGVSVGLVAAAFQGAYLVPLAVFIAPAVAAVVAFRGDLGLRRLPRTGPSARDQSLAS